MGDEAGRVQIGEFLRQDATGAWHRATWGERPMTLRILRADLSGRDDARMLFEEETRRIERLDHPALLRVHRVGRRPPRPWMLTDPIDGPTLADALAQGARWTPEEALALVRRVHDAARYLQARRQVHVAPWPSSIVRVGGAWKLLTFRWVRAWDELRTLKGRRDAWPDLTPPERGKDHPAPLVPEPWISWSLGTLLRALEGDAAPQPHAGAVARLTAQDPEARPAGRAAVEAVLAGGGGPAGRPEAPRAPLRAPVPRRRRQGR
jgi:hypothetical protein